MISVTNIMLISGDRVVAEIFADDLSDISTLETVEGRKLSQGSTAYIIKSGDIYVMGSDGVWHNSENGESAENVDLSDYYNKSQIDNLLANKIDKAAGMGLSSNDYTTTEKNKLSSLSNYDDTALKSQISAINGIPTVNSATSSSLYSYVDGLSVGEFQVMILKGSGITDVPVDDNIAVKIYVYSKNTAFMLAYPTGTQYCDKFYSVSKISGKWGKWYAFTGTVIETQTT